MSQPYDAIVIGAGLVGSWAAKELGEAGLRVLLLDAGPAIAPEMLRAASSGRDGLGYRIGRVLAGQGYLASSRILNRATDRFYVSTRENPYACPRGKPFRWVRGRQVGGRGHTWGRVAVRLSPAELASARGESAGARWPIRYEELVPSYERAERLLELEGSRDGLADLPDGDCVRPHPLVGPEVRFQQAVESRFPGVRVVPARVLAYPAGPESPVLASARATGRVTVRPDTVVARIETDRAAREATGVTAFDRVTRAPLSFHGGHIFCCASSIESVRLLLLSASDAHPGGLGNRSGLLGRFLMDHTTRWLTGSCAGEPIAPPPGPFDLAPRQGVYAPVVRPGGSFVVQGAIGRAGDDWALAAFGEMRPRAENRVTLDRRRDAWGVPVPRIECSFSPDDLAVAGAGLRFMEEAAAAAGLAVGAPGPRSVADRIVEFFRERALRRPGAAIHEAGGARMGDSPESSVTDRFNRLWDVPNVRVCDAACFPRLSFHNPTLTAMALAIRAARHAAGATP